MYDLLQVAPTVPPEWNALWLGLLGLVTSLITQGLKAAATPIAKLPDWAKAVLAFAISLGSTKLAVLIGVPIPGDLAGVASALVSWAAAMGLHALAKTTGIIKDEGTTAAVAAERMVAWQQVKK